MYVANSLQTVFPGLSTWFDIERNKIGPHEVRADSKAWAMSSMVRYYWTFPLHVDCGPSSPCTILDAYECWCHMQNQEGGS